MGKAKLLSQMMHCKTHNKNLNQVSVKKKGSSTQNVENAVKKEKIEGICRACLKEGDIPIFRSNSNEDLSNAFSMFAGVDVSPNDPYTKFLCKSCNMLLEGAILLRKTAQHSEILLKSTIVDNNYDEDDNIQSDNNYCEIKVKKKEIKYKHSQSRKDQLQMPMKVKRLVKKNIKERLRSNKIIKNRSSIQNDEIAVTDLKTEDCDVSKNSTKEKKKYYCRRCNITFNSFDELNEHKQTDDHENKKEECPICHKMYANLYIKKHMEVHGTKSCTCDICGKSFHFQVTLNQHRVTHFYELPFKCTLCPYKGRFSQSLKLHMRTHTGEKPYQCTECPAAFIQKSNLLKHARTHRNKDFNCEPCNKAFYTKRELDLHHKVAHIGIKEHICKICGKEFGYRSRMMKHTLKVHKRAKLQYGRMPLYLQVESMKQQEGIISEET